jgi:hypothetical protein
MTDITREDVIKLTAAILTLAEVMNKETETDVVNSVFSDYVLGLEKER